MFKLSNRNSTKTCSTCPNLTIKTPKNNVNANIYLLKVNNRNAGKKCKTCPDLTVKTPGQRQQHHSDVFIVNSEYISRLFLLFLLLTLNK